MPASPFHSVCSVALALCAFAETASAAAFKLEPTNLEPGVLGVALPQSAGGSQDAATQPHDGAKAYGSADTFDFEFTLGPAFDLEETSIGILDVGAHWFVADGVSVGAFVEGLVIDAENDDSWGFGIGLLARWHFVRDEDFSLFVEAGVGFAGFSDEVPAGGTDYDFTPRAAFGMTYELGGGTRLVGKVGWFHISNGQTGPDNPGLDSVSAAIGLSLPLGR